MKTTFKIIVIVLFAAFYGCQKDDVSTNASSSITSDGILSGTIVNDSNRIDSIKAYSTTQSPISSPHITFMIITGIGKSAVSTDGKFSITLISPLLFKIGTGPSGVVASDTTAMVTTVYGLNNRLYGPVYVYKANYNLYDTIRAGQSGSLFMYSDRAFTIKGTEIRDKRFSTGFIETIKTNYNITFKKGWNEFVLKIDSYSITSTTSTTVESYSNIVTSDLQWKCFIYGLSYYVRSKTRGVQDVVRQGFLFR